MPDKCCGDPGDCTGCKRRADPPMWDRNPAELGDPGYHQILQELKILHVAKSGAYGTGQDCYNNFSTVASVRKQPRFLYAMDRVQEKLARVYSLVEQGRLEELELLDIAGLVVCAESMLRQDREER